MLKCLRKKISILILMMIVSACGGALDRDTVEPKDTVRVIVPCGFIFIEADHCDRSGDKVECFVDGEIISTITDCEVCPDECEGVK